MNKNLQEPNSKKPWSITAEELCHAGTEGWPKEFSQAEALIYSSPATLSYNSPGANGFGVKRAGLVLPESVMLLVSPGCCGRNSTILSRVSGYAERMFYLLMNETDLITGRHLKKIPDAVRRICDEAKPRPKAVVICITCVDALLGTDLERVCRKAEKAVPGVHVVPSYMYALTREGTKPPMTSIRKSLYSLLERKPVNPHAVNLMGYFSPLSDDSELYPIFRKAGLSRIREISRMKTLEDYMEMGEANFNLVLHPEARYAAEDLLKRLGMPYIELRRLYDPEKIARQYDLFAAAVGITLEYGEYRVRAEEALNRFTEKYGQLRVVIGQMLNANPFELAVLFLKKGHLVPRIFAVPSEEDLPFIKEIAGLSPDTRIFTSTHPSMLEDPEGICADLCLGKDAKYFAPEAVCVPFSDDIQPFGFRGLELLLERIDAALEQNRRPQSPKHATAAVETEYAGGTAEELAYEISDSENSNYESNRLLTRLSPFAPDISGAAGVFFGHGGVIVIIDAGGCTGNVCGFDEPRWFSEKSAVFSAGLRDLDAILGRDKKLIAKIKDALQYTNARFLALIGTPVPAVIGTDFKALKRMAEKEFGLPVLTVDASGMGSYDEGEIRAYKELLKTFPADFRAPSVFGALPLDLPGEITDLPAFKKSVRTLVPEHLNAAVSPAGIRICEAVRDQGGPDFSVVFPAKDLICRIPDHAGTDIHSALIIHQTVCADSFAGKLKEELPECEVETATFFTVPKHDEALRYPVHPLKGEADLKALLKKKNYDLVVADPLIKPAVEGHARYFLPLSHFAVSGSAAAQQ